MAVDYFGYLYGVVVAAGGAIGFAKSGSIPSLAGGLLFGTAIGVGAYQFSKGPENYHFALGTSSALAGLMGSRFYKTRKFVPAGLFCIISVEMATRYAAKGLFIKEDVRS